jgi:hypothetical protein
LNHQDTKTPSKALSFFVPWCLCGEKGGSAGLEAINALPAALLRRAFKGEI